MKSECEWIVKISRHKALNKFSLNICLFRHSDMRNNKRKTFTSLLKHEQQHLEHVSILSFCYYIISSHLFSSLARCSSSSLNAWTIMDSLPPTVMAARFRGTERRLDDVPAGAFSSSVPKRPPDVTARVVFSLSVLVNNKNKSRSPDDQHLITTAVKLKIHLSALTCVELIQMSQVYELTI